VQLHQPLSQTQESLSITGKDVFNTDAHITAHSLTLHCFPILNNVYFDDRAGNGHSNISIGLLGVWLETFKDALML